MPQVNTTTSRDVTFHEVKSYAARELLALSFQGAANLHDGEDLDLYHIEHELSDDDVLKMLSKVLAGESEIRTKREVHEDGTSTHYPYLLE